MTFRIHTSDTLVYSAWHPKWFLLHYCFEIWHRIGHGIRHIVFGVRSVLWFYFDCEQRRKSRLAEIRSDERFVALWIQLADKRSSIYTEIRLHFCLIIKVYFFFDLKSINWSSTRSESSSSRCWPFFQGEGTPILFIIYDPDIYSCLPGVAAYDTVRKCVDKTTMCRTASFFNSFVSYRGRGVSVCVCVCVSVQ